MKKIFVSFLALSLLIISNTTLFAQKPTQIKGSSGAGFFIPSDVITSTPTPEESYRPTPMQNLLPKNLCAPDDDPYGYFCKDNKLYANVGKNCRGARELGENCKPESQLATPDGSDNYCVKGSLPNCNSECILPFRLPNGAECCADTVCESGYCNISAHQCQDPTATPVPALDPYESPTDYFSYTSLLFGAIVIILFLLVGGRKLIFR